MATLSEWLKIMLGEIARKQDEAAKAETEQKLRQSQQQGVAPAGSATR
jgi:hypothetical protein